MNTIFNNNDKPDAIKESVSKLDKFTRKRLQARLQSDLPKEFQDLDEVEAELQEAQDNLQQSQEKEKLIADRLESYQSKLADFENPPQEHLDNLQIIKESHSNLCLGILALKQRIQIMENRQNELHKKLEECQEIKDALDEISFQNFSSLNPSNFQFDESADSGSFKGEHNTVRPSEDEKERNSEGDDFPTKEYDNVSSEKGSSTMKESNDRKSNSKSDSYVSGEGYEEDSSSRELKDTDPTETPDVSDMFKTRAPEKVGIDESS